MAEEISTKYDKYTVISKHNGKLNNKLLNYKCGSGNCGTNKTYCCRYLLLLVGGGGEAIYGNLRSANQANVLVWRDISKSTREYVTLGFAERKK